MPSANLHAPDIKWPTNSRPLFTSLSAQQTNASSYIAWRPPCETLPTDTSYLYKGPHELDSYSLCLVGHASSSTPASPIVSAPRCIFVRVLRCTHPELNLLQAVGQRAAPEIPLPQPLVTAFPSHPTTITKYVVPAGTLLKLVLNGTDDSQTQLVEIKPARATGLSDGFVFQTPLCDTRVIENFWFQPAITRPPARATCNPTITSLFFAAGLRHAGLNEVVCAEAVNDQSLCPHRTSISPALCWGIEVPPPVLEWAEGGGKGAGGVVVGGLTPLEDEERLTYLGCPLDLVLSARDSSGYFDVAIDFVDTYDPLMEGAQMSPPTCTASQTLPIAGQDNAGILTCVSTVRRLVYTPVMKDQGLKARICFQATTQTSHAIQRCFRIFVSKCRYCVQPGESLEEVARSFDTDWLQLYSANPHITKPHALPEYELINLGALYPVRPGDTLAAIQERFQGSMTALQRANPEIVKADETMPTGKLICVLPAVCITGGF